MSAADSAWLRMDRSTNHMLVTALLRMRHPMTREQLIEILDHRIARHPRFRTPLLLHRWSSRTSEPFDVHRHVLDAPFDGPVDEARLRGWIGEMMARPLPVPRRWWEVYFIERYGTGTALLFRLHHSLADGMALMRVLMSAVDEPAAVKPIRMPMHGRGRLRGSKLVEGVLTSFARLALLPKDRTAPLKGALSGEKRVAWTPAIPLERVKAAGCSTGATINDVLTSALAGALSRYLVLYREGRPRRWLRAIVPYDLRAGETDEHLGNRFGLLFLPLPISPMSPIERLKKVNQRIDHLKNTPEAWVAYGLLETIGRISSRLAGGAIRLFGRKGSIVLTNVAGPRQRVRICGVELDDLVFWVPQAGGIGVGFSFFSYAGSVRLGVSVDTRRVEDPQVLADLFVAEFEALATAAEPVTAAPRQARGEGGAARDGAVEARGESLQAEPVEA